jgi:[histone H3]-lysine4 N-trimethyltransferase SETD1
MQLIDGKDSTRAAQATASPPRRKPLPKKTLEEEATEAILVELQEIFIKDVRSRIINPMILDFLDPSHYKDIQPKKEPEKTVLPDVKVTPVKETVPLNRLSTNRIPSLPRFRKKGVEPLKDDMDRKPTKADVRPMHHQFNHYSDSEDEDELPQREATVASDDEDESSRPSRETTTLSTPEPSRIKGKTLVKTRDVAVVKEEMESDGELLKDILDTANNSVPSTTKRKRMIDFTSSEDEDEPSPSKKVCVDSEVPEIFDAMEIDVQKLPKAALLKAAKVKAAALRKAKKADAKVKEPEDSVAIESIPTKEVKAQIPPKPKIPEVNLTEIEDDKDMLLDLDGVQTLVRDREDYRYLLEALVDVIPETIQDIWSWSWMQKKLKALNFDGAHGTYPRLFISNVQAP